MNRSLVAALVALLALALAGCGNTGIICSTNEVRCGQTCANLATDPDHCGACGTACATGFSCQNSLCVCPSSLNLTACGQACVDLRSAVGNCGSCGNACAAGQVCSNSACATSCAAGSVPCGGGCVDPLSDRANCGGCSGDGGAVCAQGQACTAGVCGSDLFAACFNTGEVIALDAAGEIASPTRATNPPIGPVAMAFHGHDELTVVDGSADSLYSFDVTNGFGAVNSFTVGAGPTAVAISGDVAAVVNSSDNSLDVLTAAGPGWARRCPPNADGGCLASVHFDPDSSPERAAFDTDAIYVTLQGNLFTTSTSGNRLARVSLADLSVQLVDLSGLDLQAPDAGTEARPVGVAVGNGKVFVALANLAGYTGSGPGLVATYDLVPDGGVPVLHGQPVALGAGCYNAGTVRLVESTLYVGCGPIYDPNFPYTAIVTPGALAALNVDTGAPAFAPQILGCPADAGACEPGAVAGVALAAGKLYVGDLVDGRLFIADPTTGALERGPTNPLVLCAAPDGGYNFIGDVVARP